MILAVISNLLIYAVAKCAAGYDWLRKQTGTFNHQFGRVLATTNDTTFIRPRSFVSSLRFWVNLLRVFQTAVFFVIHKAMLEMRSSPNRPSSQLLQHPAPF
ncbi:MAG: hypothetical protein H6656_03035 [Ardenticatenaceae bacterium]|nr:hypothetical protein [Ardenticatenaceae bacterium]